MLGLGSKLKDESLRVTTLSSHWKYDYFSYYLTFAIIHVLGRVEVLVSHH